MSNRSLIEINHDMWNTIDLNDTEFVADLLSYLRAGGETSKKKLTRYGIRVFGMRHHTDPYAVDWGGRVHSEGI